MAAQQVLEIGDLRVTVTRRRGQKHLYLRVLPPDGKVSVSAPTRVPVAEITRFVLDKLPYITAHQERIRALPTAPAPTYDSGEVHYLWGEPYELEVVPTQTRPSVAARDHRLILHMPAGHTTQTRANALTDWYRNQLREALNPAVQRCTTRTGITANEFRIKNMKTRWGTCNIAKRRIWLSVQLAQKPALCLDYVLTHELTHLVEPNHTDRFHQLVRDHFPKWEQAEAALRSTSTRQPT